MSRRSVGERWDAEALARIRVAPGTGCTPKSRSQIRCRDRPAVNGPTAEAICQVALQKVRVNQSDLDEHGYTQGCPRCQSTLVYGPNVQSSTPHSDACRQRIMIGLFKTEEGQLKIQRAQERTDRYLADRIREQAEAPAPAQGGKSDVPAESAPQREAPTSAFAPSAFAPYRPEPVQPAASADPSGANRLVRSSQSASA